MDEQHSLAKFRFDLPGDQVVDDIYARSEAEACVELDRRRPGMSGRVLKLTRDDFWWLGEAPSVRQGARR